MTEPELIQVNLTHERLCCPGHGQPFQAQFPRGFPHYVQFVWSALLEVKDIHKVADKPENVHALLDHKPACCWLKPSVLTKVYFKVLDEDELVQPSYQKPLWKASYCRICNTLAPGLTVLHLKHVCLGCIARRLRA